MAYRLTRKALMADLYAAFVCAKRHKASKPYVKHFERRLMENLNAMADALLDRTYQPEPSTCFIVESPKKREVFAAQFRDRVVHHLYYNYTHRLFERTFIQDSYSCIPERGTHYGIDRMTRHIRQESRNWTRPCYALKLDIRGYFMHINRQRLLQIAAASLVCMADRRCEGSLRWRDVIDFDFIMWLTHEIIMLDPTVGCHRAGDLSEWDGVDESKLMRNAPDGCGMPIGNLTSQLFSNVYMNPFDQMVKRLLQFMHYGRYVDDSDTISSDRQRLMDAIPVMRDFLKQELCLDLHMGKTLVTDVRQGVEFLGAFILPHRTYISRRSLERMETGVENIDTTDAEATYRSVNSYLGVLGHYSSYNIRRRLFLQERLLHISTFNNNISVYNKPINVQAS